MDCITCRIFDRVAEDAILLYDAYQVYEKMNEYINKSKDDLDESEEVVIRSGIIDEIRYVFTSILSDLAVLPLWQVNVSAIAQRERIRGLLPFNGFVPSLKLIYKSEGFKGFFKGWIPVCTGGFLRFYYRQGQLFNELYSKPFERFSWIFLRQNSEREYLVRSEQYDSESIITRAFWSTLLHPFDLVATRMITETCPDYDTALTAFKYITKKSGFLGLFEGVHLSITNSILPSAIISFGNWYMLGIPFLLKTRRMLDGMDLMFNVGLSGSLDMLRDILRREGFSGLFSGWNATLNGIIPAFCSLCLARAAIYLVFGSRYKSQNRRKRRKFLKRYRAA